MVEVNGRQIQWQEGMTVQSLLDDLNYTFPKIVVRINGEVVEKKDWKHYIIPDRAVVQAHHLIAGG